MTPGKAMTRLLPHVLFIGLMFFLGTLIPDKCPDWKGFAIVLIAVATYWCGKFS
jgi:hypothetical protein